MRDLTTSECINVLIDNYNGYLGFIARKSPYVLPISYFYDQEDHAIISYSAAGHKIDSMRKYPTVSLAVEEIESVYNWQSVLVHGTFEEIEGASAKQKLHKFTEGVKGLILRKENRETEFISEFSSKIYSRGVPVVYRIKILEMTGKRKET